MRARSAGIPCRRRPSATPSSGSRTGPPGPWRRAALDDYERVLPRLRALPRQLIHNDGHTDNLLVDAGRAAAIVDFGDVVAAPRVCGLAVACAYAALETERPLRVVCEVTAGYHDVAPLEAVELELLFDLVRTRLAVSACMAARQSRADPDNEYLLVSQHAVPRALAQLAAENRHLAHFGLRDACGLEPSPTAFAVRSFLARRDPEPAPVVDAPLDTAVVLDWSTANAEVTRLARAGEIAALSALVEEELDAAGATVGVGRYLEDRGVYAGEAFSGRAAHRPHRARPVPARVGDRAGPARRRRRGERRVCRRPTTSGRWPSCATRPTTASRSGRCTAT